MTSTARDHAGTQLVGTPRTYAALSALPGFLRLCAAALLARTAQQMLTVVLVLFVLARYGSPQLAGLVVLCSTAPGLFISPVAGALLDRGARMRLVAADYLLGAASLAAIASLAWSGRLPSWLLLAIVFVSSLTGPLSNSGTRSLIPVMVPRHLWDRANAVDSGGFVIATVLGPGIGGVLVAVLGGTGALVVNAVLFLAAAAVAVTVQDPSQRTGGERAGIATEAWHAVRYVVTNPVLRGLVVTLWAFNLGFGCLTVTLPVLVAGRTGGGGATVGFLWALLGIASLVAVTITGRFDSSGREHLLMLAGAGIGLLAYALLLPAAGIVVISLALALFGISNAPVDIGLFALRQRWTSPAMLGRAFAVSAALNFFGMPIGAAIGGVLAAHSPEAAVWFCVASNVAAALVVPVMLRPLWRGERPPR